MSRIDEALRQAGLKAEDAALVDQQVALDNFPLGSDEPVPATDRRRPAEVSSLASGHVPPSSEPTSSPQPPPSPRAPWEPGRKRMPARFAQSEKLVIHENAGHGCVEQYRRVAATLHQMQEQRGTKTLMVASASMGEGKTLTAANLALTLSESYQRKVLLIDADMRRPSLTSLFGVQAVSGLSESLRSASRAPLRVLALSERLSLLPGGRPDSDPMAGLTSGRMQEILEDASADYDWVVLDTPPVSLQPDAHLISALVEATILVIGAGVSQSQLVESAITTIGREKIVGVVLNRVDPSAFNESAYYDYYYDQGDGARASSPPAKGRTAAS